MTNSHKRTKQTRLYVVWILIVIFVASCGSSDRSQQGLSDVMPSPTEAPPVEYGASLDEWDEATQDGATQDEATQDGAEEVESSAESATAETDSDSSTAGIPFTFDNVVYQEIMWEGLVPSDFSAEVITAKYASELARFADGSPEAMEIFTKMQEEFNNAPVNEMLDESLIRLPGFIAPLDYQDDIITEFLLVPYFGACIHVPPPPVNQTVLVNTSEGQGIKVEDSWNPVWVMGKLTTEETTTELAAAGYYIQDAIVEPYTEP